MKAFKKHISVLVKVTALMWRCLKIGSRSLIYPIDRLDSLGLYSV